MTDHVNPTQCRTASAPYNFIPLPEKVVPAVTCADELPRHDAFIKGRRSGYFKVDLEARSPIFVRGPVVLNDYLSAVFNPDTERRKPFIEQIKNRPQFFFLDSKSPVIPGSSLRGMLRGLTEILTFSKITRVTKRNYYFRSLEEGSTLGSTYKERMIGKTDGDDGKRVPKVKGGYIRKASNKYFVIQCDVVRVDIDDLLSCFGLEHESCLYMLNHKPLSDHSNNPNQIPNPDYQHKKLLFRLPEGSQKAVDVKLEKDVDQKDRDNMLSGRLVLTGRMIGKKSAFIFCDARGSKIGLDSDVVKAFQSQDQVTQWQAKAFPKNDNKNTRREANAFLRHGEPVFFTTKPGDDGNENVDFLGRAFMFRIPYLNTPFDLIPFELRDPNVIDFAEAIFGYVRTNGDLEDMNPKPEQGTPARGYAGRVSVTDADMTSAPNGGHWWSDPFTPHQLSGPKPTAFQHYLYQPKPQASEDLLNYDSENVKLRGHKQYWHQGKIEFRDVNAGNIERSNTHTRMQPVNPGTTFTFRVYFNNLSDVELGALCWALNPDGDSSVDYCHKLGMGKPYGLGGVKLSSRLFLCNRRKRHRSLFEGDGWCTGYEGNGTPIIGSEFTRLTEKFEEYMRDHLDMPHSSRLRDHKRVKALLKMLEWPGFKAQPDGGLYIENENRPNTRYMTVIGNNEYEDRPVLPDPGAFGSPSGDGADR